jgi:hypothetical protein
MITNIDIDEALVAEAIKVSGARTKREVVDRALRELVARGKRTRMRDVFGMGGIDPDYDPKDSLARGAEVGRWRVEQPLAEYKVKPPAVPAPGRAARKR